MNRSAAVVLFILGLVAVACTLTLCYNSIRTGDVKDVKEIAVFALGAISAVLAKVGIDAIKGDKPAPPADPLINVETAQNVGPNTAPQG